MKKLSFTPKAKKITVISGVAAVCVCVLSIILCQGNSAENARARAAGTVPSSATTTEAPTSVTPSPITGTATVSTPSGIAGTGSAWTPSSGSKVSAPLTITPKPESAPPKPVIQGDSKDGKQPTNSALTDKTTKPTYTAPPKAPEKSPASSTPATNNNGDSTKKSNDNDPFNHVTHETGGNKEVVVGDMYEDGTKIGIMD